MESGHRWRDDERKEGKKKRSKAGNNKRKERKNLLTIALKNVEN